MDKFASLEAFVTVVDAGSFSAAGERLGVAKSIVCRRVSQLEQQLGSRLLNRTTRSLALTDAGRNLHQRALQILGDLEDAERSISDEVSELGGSIRLAAPLSFGLQHLSDLVAGFMVEHPAIAINLDLNDRNVQLVEEGFDMAVRIGTLDDSSLVARRLGHAEMLVCASAAYLDNHGVPEHPDELVNHFGLQYSHVSEKQQWTFETPEGKSVQAHPDIRLRANNGEALAKAAVRGLGIFSGPDFILQAYLESGRLVPILSDYRRAPVGIHALFPPGRLTPRRIQMFTQYLADRLGMKQVGVGSG